MAIDKIYAHLSCASLAPSIGWFTALFGRTPDARPMDGLAEWHHGDGAGFQLFENAEDAGHGTLTLIASAIADEHRRLTQAGLGPDALEQGAQISLIRLRDPDGNPVVLAQPGRA